MHLVYCDNAGKKGEHILDKIISIVTSVPNYVKLSEEGINQVFSENESKLALTQKQKDRWHKKCICLIKFVDAERIHWLCCRR